MVLHPFKIQLSAVIVGAACILAGCGVRGNLTVNPKPPGATAPVDVRTTPEANVLMGADGKTVLVPKPVQPSTPTPSVLTPNQPPPQ